MRTEPSTDCELCAERAGWQSRFGSLYRGHLSSRIMAQTANFLVLPSLGQLGDAHLMVISREHKTAVSNVTADQRDEMLTIVGDVRNFLVKKFGRRYVIFENGDPEGQGRMGCSISHMHIHLVGFRHQMPDLYTRIRGLGGYSFRGGLGALSEFRQAYSYAEFPAGEGLIVSRPLPSQTLRKVISDAMRSPKWNWQEAAVEEQIIGLVTSRPLMLSGHE
jgi:ATP adenylyltransferase